MLLTKFRSVAAVGLMAGILLGGVFLLAGKAPATGEVPAKTVAPAPVKEASKWPGEWLFEGKEDQPCAIFQHGRVLLLVNEEGELETARITEANKIVCLSGSWEEGLVGELTDKGKTIAWGNGTTWKRP